MPREKERRWLELQKFLHNFFKKRCTIIVESTLGLDRPCWWHPPTPFCLGLGKRNQPCQPNPHRPDSHFRHSHLCNAYAVKRQSLVMVMYGRFSSGWSCMDNKVIHLNSDDLTYYVLCIKCCP